MPWEESSTLSERLSFIGDYERGEAGLAELCRWYGISRKTGYKWVARYEAEGPSGLEGRSRAPHHHPNAVSAELIEAIVAVRRRHMSWGPKKIRAWLAAREPERCWPVESTMGELLKRAGLVASRRRRAHAPRGGPLGPCAAANDVWGTDFKGWFRTGDGARCDPFTLSDLHSRYVIRLQAMERTGAGAVWPLFDAAFREFGLPLRVRSDNGQPFGSVAVGGLTPLAINLVKAGVTPERIAPGKPQQNGRHERFHWTLELETAQPPAASLRAQQRRFDTFRREFNEERPHEALGQAPPTSCYAPSPRSWSGRLREPEYSDQHVVRRVRPNGELRWNGECFYLGQVLAGEPVGLVEGDESHWHVWYGPLPLGAIVAKKKFLRLAAGACPRCEQTLQTPDKTVTHVPG
jgi:putative transposase